MPLSLKEIAEHEEALRQEIAEREHLLGAYQRMRADRENALGLPPRLIVGATTVPSLAPAAPSVAPSVAAPVAPYRNVELYARSTGHGGTGRAVKWILRQITDEFTVHDVAALLQCEGAPMPIARLSTVLNRMKGYGEITEISNGRGRRPSVYRTRATPVIGPTEVPGAETNSAPLATEACPFAELALSSPR